MPAPVYADPFFPTRRLFQAGLTEAYSDDLYAYWTGWNDYYRKALRSVAASVSDGDLALLDGSPGEYLEPFYSATPDVPTVPGGGSPPSSDPFPQYVTEAEVAATLAGYASGADLAGKADLDGDGTVPADQLPTGSTSPYLIKQSDVYRLARSDVGTSNDTAAVSAIVAAAKADGVTKVLLPPGLIRIPSTAGVPLGAGAVEVAGYGYDTEVRYTGTASGAGVFSATGTESSKTALAVDAAAGTQTVTLPSGVVSGLAVGSMVCLESDLTAFGAVGFNPTRAKEMRRVLAVSGTSVTLDGPLIWDYLVADNAQVTVVTPIRGVRLKDLLITSGDDGVAAKNYAVFLNRCTDVEVENVTIRRGGGGIALQHVADARLANIHVDGLPSLLDAYGYGVVVSGPSAHINIDGLHGRNFRHLFTTAYGGAVVGGKYDGGGPRHITIRGGVGEGSPNGFAVWDTHETGYDITFDNCRAFGGTGASANGFQIRSRKTRIVAGVARRTGAVAVRCDTNTSDDVEIIGGEFAYAAAGGGIGTTSRTRVKGASIHHNTGPGVGVTAVSANLQVTDCDIYDNTYGVQDQSAGAASNVVIGSGNRIPYSATQTISALSLSAGVVFSGNVLTGYGAGLDGTSSPSTASIRLGNILDGGVLQHTHPGLWQPADNGLKAWTFDPALTFDTGIAPTLGQVQLARVVLPTAATLTNVLLMVKTAGATLTLGQVALFDSGGTQRAITADQAAALQSTGAKTFAFTTPYAAPAGTYYVGILTTGTTAPAIARASSGSTATGNAGLSAAPYRFAAHGTSLTAMPSSVTYGTASPNGLWFGLS